MVRFKIFVKTEGVYRVNHQGQTSVEYDVFVGPLLTPMSESERLVCSFAFASILSSPNVAAFSRPFQDNYTALQSQIETLCLPLLDDDDKKSKAMMLKQLIQTNDYVGVSVLVAIDVDGGEHHPLHDWLINSCCNGTIVTAWHDQAMRNLAMCFLIKKEHRRALEIVERVAFRNPDWLDIQIFVAQILGEMPGAEPEATQKVTDLRRTYRLTPDDEARLAAIETEITKRRDRT